MTGTDSVKNGVTAQLSQRGIELSITTNKVKDRSKILYAVWSEQNGQNDLNWYQADKSGKALANYENHSGYGTYHIRTYSNETGRMVGLGTQTITIARPSMTSIITKVNDSTFTIEVKVPHYMRDVKIPVWSNKNGQDDIKWYNATHQGNSTYTLTVSAQNHKRDLGQYQAHVYGNSLLENKRQVGLGRTEGFTVNRIVSPYSSPNARVDNSPNTYPVGECTWGAKQVASWASNNWGHANQWADNAQRDGFTVETTPVKGAIIVMQHGSSSGDGYIYGHVGVVQNINPDGTLIILESNLNKRRYVGNHRGNYNHLRHEHGGWIRFIYPPA